jgi:cell wall-associated NlpC family hydrolase
MIRLDLAARAYLKWGPDEKPVPFLHQGRDPNVGIDCVGLLVLAARGCGLDELTAHDISDYARDPARGELEARLRKAFGAPVRDLSPGCVVSIEFHKPATRHVAIVGEHPHGLSLIHTYKSPAQVIEHGLDDKWRKRITGIYRMEAV